MLNVTLELLVVGGGVTTVFLLVVGSRAANTAGSATNSKDTDQNHPEVPRAGPLDWNREPPSVRHPENQDTESKPREAQEGKDDPAESDEAEPADLEFDWQKDIPVSFADVGGKAELKERLRRDIIYPLKTDSDLIERMSIPVQNVLFYGPPGTGKTYIARALAGELDVPFVHLSAAELQSKWINESPAKVKSLFSEASQIAERYGGAVVFVDELDAVLASRRTAKNSHAEDSKVVNEFLHQLQQTHANNIAFLGATNREDILDEAAIRSGRIDTHVRIPMPDLDDRIEILKTQLDSRPHKVSEPNVNHAARQLKGKSAADIASIVDAAARQAVIGRAGEQITWGDLQMAIEDFLTEQET